MLPEPSVVQHCPHCDKYFFFEDSKPSHIQQEQKKRPSFIEELFNEFKEKEPPKTTDTPEDMEAIEEEADNNDFGGLYFEEVSAAFDSLYSDKLSKKKKEQLLSLWLFSYNDVFSARTGGILLDALTPAIQERHTAVLNQLITIHSGKNNMLFVSELYRELGEFEKSKEIASALMNGKGDKATVARQIYENAEKHNKEVFKLVFRGKHDTSTVQ